jgi:uncharacterized protein YndB with AHSA1/START domain
MSSETKTRSIELEIPIDAPVEAVWKALTEPEELTRWFPLEARVEPGGGGAIALSWGPEAEGENRIRIWEPDSRLQTGWFAGTEAFGNEPRMHSAMFREDPETARRLLVDYQLEGQGGRTVLRLVHSGFSADARWDEEFEAHNRGWRFELRSLRNYLEHHRGEARSVAQVSVPVEGHRQAAWSRLMSPDGMGDVTGLKESGRYTLTTVHGDQLEGEVVGNRPPAEFAATVENMGHALLRGGVETCWGRPTALIWLSTWGEHRTLAAPFEQRWKETFAGFFPGTA